MNFAQLHSGNQVKNATGTANARPNNSSTWRQHWEKKTGEGWPWACSRKYCQQQASDGAHVHLLIQSANQSERYIIPLCHSCNMDKTQPFEVKTVKAVKAY